jgi:hypothetical protein
VLIHVDESGVTEALSAGELAPQSHDAIEHLLSAHCEGSHVLSLRREDTRRLLDAPLAWSRGARRALLSIHDGHPVIAGLRADIPWSMELGFGAGFEGRPPIEESLGDGRTVVRARLDAFDQRRKTARCVLLGEGPNDAPLFIQIGRMMLAARVWEWLRLELTPRPGGGNTTADVFRVLADEGQIVLAVCDTDRRYPQSGVGGTYHRVDLAARGCPAYQRAQKIHVRTAEALIPVDVYREVLTSPERRANVDKLEPLIAADPRVLSCAHLKDGIKWFQVKRPRSEPEGAYWRGLAATVSREGCNEPESPECQTREECRCYVVHPLGGAAVSEVVKWLQEQHDKRPVAERFRVSPQAGPARDPDLSALADEIVSFGLALSPLT